VTTEGRPTLVEQISAPHGVAHYIPGTHPSGFAICSTLYPRPISADLAATLDGGWLRSPLLPLARGRWLVC
jgi:hypothetical protein